MYHRRLKIIWRLRTLRKLMRRYIKYYAIINLIFTYKQKLFKAKKNQIKAKTSLEKTAPQSCMSDFLSNEFQEILRYFFMVFCLVLYSCSIGHIWKHEFCHLGCWAVKGKFLKRRNFCFKYATFWGDFFNFLWAKNFLKIFLKLCWHPHWKVA